jgi:hypothetical protein
MGVSLPFFKRMKYWIFKKTESLFERFSPTGFQNECIDEHDKVVMTSLIGCQNNCSDDGGRSDNEDNNNDGVDDDDDDDNDSDYDPGNNYLQHNTGRTLLSGCQKDCSDGGRDEEDAEDDKDDVSFKKDHPTLTYTAIDYSFSVPTIIEGTGESAAPGGYNDDDITVHTLNKRSHSRKKRDNNCIDEGGRSDNEVNNRRLS